MELDLDVDLAGGAEDIVAHLGERIPDLVATAIVVCLAIIQIQMKMEIQIELYVYADTLLFSS